MTKLGRPENLIKPKKVKITIPPHTHAGLKQLKDSGKYAGSLSGVAAYLVIAQVEALLQDTVSPVLVERVGGAKQRRASKK